jgi:hypothetical protein
MPAPKLGILYPFRLPDWMLTAILTGYGDNMNYQVRDARDGVAIDSNGQALKAGVDKLLADQCKVIAVIGGLHVHKAINEYKTDQYTFVSMVGGNPSDHGPHNRGGPNLHTPISNKDRIGALLNLGLKANEICLYHDPMFSDKSYDNAINQLEKTEWNKRQYWQGGTPGPIKDSSRNFAQDFSTGGLPKGVRGVVISASPFFLSSLTGQSNGMPNTTPTNIAVSANAWISAGGTGMSQRYVIYPFQEYLIGGHPDQAVAIGPSLTLALTNLGKRAKDGQVGDPFKDEPDADSRQAHGSRL